MDNSKELAAIQESILKADLESTKTAISAAIEAGVEPTVILANGITGAMQKVGEKWAAKEFWLPDVMAAADTVKQGIDFMQPYIASKDGSSAGKVVIGTVEGDVHNVGKNLVATFMTASGFEVHDLGEDVPAEKFVEAAKAYDADIIGMSCFATNVTPVMTHVNELLVEDGLRDKVYTMIGGISMGPEWVPVVGADVYTKDAYEASEAALKHMSEKNA